ncbi:nonribosomal peptide [Colletotrichum incanum]|uniref:Nonribosomal peptide n=1 Tax=Colletotrichum incanum TaxID=1573173 RepID=A0A166ZNU9_COLIC|nr:nonribosomal peptide [Colletotrichum incanum]
MPSELYPCCGLLMMRHTVFLICFNLIFEFLRTPYFQEDRAINLAPQSIVVSTSSLSALAGIEQLEIEVTPSDVSVVIFTSGTTGTPKRIQIEHKVICSSLGFGRALRISRQTRNIQFSPYPFDAALGDILMTLMRAGCVCIPSDADPLNNLAESIRNFDAHAGLLTLTIARSLSPPAVPCLTTLVSGGDKVTQDVVGLWADKLDLIIATAPRNLEQHASGRKATRRMIILFGSGFLLTAVLGLARLDDPNQLAPVGAIGELVAEGPGIPRGYERQLESIVTSMERSYRTGYLVRYADDGELTFDGRRDRQVKLRGQRIKLEDIETKLKQHLRLMKQIHSWKYLI